MSNLELIHASCADQKVDAIVNAANNRLAAGGGICGEIFKRAGKKDLEDACREYQTPLKDGSAVITSSFNLNNAKAIIHAVGPDFGITSSAFKELFEAYYKSLVLLKENGYHSISFPLISSGIFGGRLENPVAESTKQCLRAYKKFTKDYPDYEIDVKLCAYTDEEMQEATAEFECRMTKTNEMDNAGNPVPSLNDDNDTLPEITDTPYGRWSAGAGSIGKVGDPIPYLQNRKKTGGVREFRINGRIEYAIFFHKPDEPCGWLSNWYKSDFVLDGIKFSSVEQYIMYQKCVLFGDEETANKIMKTDDPAEQQAIARNASGYIENVWKGYRQMVAEKALYAKFSQNDILREKLLLTQNTWLVECARSDKNWACGIGLDDDRRLDAANWTGMNILGFALMKVREDLRECSQKQEGLA